MSAYDMLIVHNVLLRGVNSIHRQCVGVGAAAGGDPTLVPDFVAYARLWGNTVSTHHMLEEELLFPRLEARVGEPGLMGASVEQHHAFHVGLEGFNAYLDAVKEGKEKYDGAKLRDMLDGFVPVLTAHLTDEIDTLMTLERFKDLPDWETWCQKLQLEVRSQPRLQDSNLKVSLQHPHPLVLTESAAPTERLIFLGFSSSVYRVPLRVPEPRCDV